MQDAARACKAGLVATAVIAVSVVGHLAAGGVAHVLSPTFPMAIALTYAVLFALPVRVWSAKALIPVLVVSQILLHCGMQIGMEPRILYGLFNTSPQAMTPMAGVTSDPTAGTAMTSVAVAPMLLAHVVAIAAAYVLVRRGDRLIDALIALLGAVVPRLTILPTLVVVAGAPVSRCERVVVLRPCFLIADVVRRGPPAVLPTPAPAIT